MWCSLSNAGGGCEDGAKLWKPVWLILLLWGWGSMSGPCECWTRAPPLSTCPSRVALKKSDVHIWCDPGILILDIYLREMKTFAHTPPAHKCSEKHYLWQPRMEDSTNVDQQWMTNQGMSRQRNVIHSAGTGLSSQHSGGWYRRVVSSSLA
jgi:hypothetical protein